MPINVPVNVKMLAKSMIDAARQATSSSWTEVRPTAEMQLRTPVNWPPPNPVQFANF